MQNFIQIIVIKKILGGWWVNMAVKDWKFFLCIVERQENIFICINKDLNNKIYGYYFKYGRNTERKRIGENR